MGKVTGIKYEGKIVRGGSDNLLSELRSNKRPDYM